MNLPKIGIPLRQVRDSTSTTETIGVRRPYLEAVLAAGGLPVMVPIGIKDEQARAYYEALDGLLLAGGEDVDPALYGESPHAKLGQVSKLRDDLEIKLVRWARDDKMPVLGICRGIQVVNVALGGSLYQDLESQCNINCTYHNSGSWEKLVHPVKVQRDSRLFEILQTDVVQTNSLHHQAVKVPGSELIVTAKSDDGVIEGIELKSSDHFLVCVQCHPETLWESIDERWAKLFKALVSAAMDWSAESRRC